VDEIIVPYREKKALFDNILEASHTHEGSKFGADQVQMIRFNEFDVYQGGAVN
jgi:glycine cleavage system aminomethyltransferase T